MIADRKEQIKRLSTCFSCEDFSSGVGVPFIKYKKKHIVLPISGVGQCKQCGCIMKLKVQISDVKCPIGKW